MRTLALLTVLAASCSGGGGGGPSWSTDIRASHPMLLGYWQGEAWVDGTPLREFLQAPVTHLQSDPPGRVLMSCSSPDPGFDLGAFLQAAGDTVRSVDGSDFQLDMRLTNDGTSYHLDGTYRLTVGPRAGATGRIMLTRIHDLPTIQPLTIVDRYVFDDLDLTIIREVR